MKFGDWPDPDSMASFYAEQEMLAEASADPQINDVTPITRESVWFCRDGSSVLIKNMTDHHLLNTIRMLAGASPIGTRFNCDPVVRRELLNAMANEAYRRGLILLGHESPSPTGE